MVWKWCNGCAQHILYPYTAHVPHSCPAFMSCRPLVLDIVRTVAAGIRIPLFVKIRLLDTVRGRQAGRQAGR